MWPIIAVRNAALLMSMSVLRDVTIAAKTVKTRNVVLAMWQRIAPLNVNWPKHKSECKKK